MQQLWFVKRYCWFIQERRCTDRARYRIRERPAILCLTKAWENDAMPFRADMIYLNQFAWGRNITQFATLLILLSFFRKGGIASTKIAQNKLVQALLFISVLCYCRCSSAPLKISSLSVVMQDLIKRAYHGEDNENKKHIHIWNEWGGKHKNMAAEQKEIQERMKQTCIKQLSKWVSACCGLFSKKNLLCLNKWIIILFSLVADSSIKLGKHNSLWSRSLLHHTKIVL